MGSSNKTKEVEARAYCKVLTLVQNSTISKETVFIGTLNILPGIWHVFLIMGRYSEF